MGLKGEIYNNIPKEMTYVRGGDMWGGSPSAWEGETGKGESGSIKIENE